jgi:hypothetical protein
VTDRLLILRSEAPSAFVADACAALADIVNEPHLLSSDAHEERVAVYAALVRAYAGLLRLGTTDEAQRHIVDHLLGRITQAELGEIVTPVADIVDRLHGELENVPASE